MAATLSRADAMRRAGASEAARAVELADLFCSGARRRIGEFFRGIRSNDDVAKYRAAMGILDGEFAWLEAGMAPGEWEPQAEASPAETPTRVARR